MRPDQVLQPRFSRDAITPGTVRMPFSLADASQLLSTGPEVIAAKIFDDGGRVVDSVSAKRRRVDEGIVYWDFHPTLDQVGVYTIVLDGGDPAGTAIKVSEPSTVLIPVVGQRLPPFNTPTHDDPRGVTPICTRTGGTCPFHTTTLAAALGLGRPVAYLIGTPAHCKFGTCAPGLEFLMRSVARLGDRVVAVHAEVYRDDTATTVAPAVDAYNLQAEPDLWLTDASGTIVNRFEGVWDQSELDEALNAL